MDDEADRVRKAVAEPIVIVEYNPEWPRMFKAEKAHLFEVFPSGVLTRVEHFGSTAVPGLASKPVIDILAGVRSLSEVRETVAPRLVAEGYEYFWRPTFGDNVGPFYAFFIKRDPATGERTHHIHVVEEEGFDEHWARLVFRDQLIADPALAREYARLKRDLAARRGVDRATYTEGKNAFISAAMERAKQLGWW